MLTPIDIDNYAFKRAKIGGYDIDSVEEFMEMLSIDYETLYKESSKLKEEIEASKKLAEELKEKNAEYEEEKEKLEEEIREKLENEYKEKYQKSEIKEDYKFEEKDIVKKLSNRSEEENFEEICESVKTSAYLEAEEILRRANEVAETKINEVDSLIKEKKTEYEDLKKQIQLYKIRFEAMLQTQLKLLNNPEFEIADKTRKKK